MPQLVRGREKDALLLTLNSQKTLFTHRLKENDTFLILHFKSTDRKIISNPCKILHEVVSLTLYLKAGEIKMI